MSGLIFPSMRRAVITGPYGWDRNAIPDDEVFLRRRWLRETLKALELDLLLVYGDAQECGALTWATNFHPKLHWATAVVDRSGESVLCVPGPIRDVPAARALSFECETMPIQRLAAVVERQLAAGGGQVPLRVGVLERSAWSLDAEQSLRGIAGAGSIELRDVPAHLVPMPFGNRDAALLRRARTLWTSCAGVFDQVWRRTRCARESMRETELHARLEGAHEVRLLASQDSGATLEPMCDLAAAAGERGVAYLAVQYLGVWVDGFHTVQPDDSELLRAAKSWLDQSERLLQQGHDVERAPDPLRSPGARKVHPMLGRGCITWQGRRLRTLGAPAWPPSGAPVALHAGLLDDTGGVLLTRFIDEPHTRNLL